MTVNSVKITIIITFCSMQSTTYINYNILDTAKPDHVT